MQSAPAPAGGTFCAPLCRGTCESSAAPAGLGLAFQLQQQRNPQPRRRFILQVGVSLSPPARVCRCLGEGTRTRAEAHLQPHTPVNCARKDNPGSRLRLLSSAARTRAHRPHTLVHTGSINKIRIGTNFYLPPGENIMGKGKHFRG